MINYPEEIMLVRGSATFLHMVLSDNTDNEMRSSIVDAFSQGSDYYQLFSTEWSRL